MTQPTQQRTSHPAYLEAFNRTWGTCAALTVGLPMVAVSLGLSAAIVYGLLRLFRVIG